MKHLFKEGKFVEEEGKKRLEIQGTDEQADKLFAKSAFYMTSLVSLYDFKKLEGTDYYYIYKEYGFTGSKRQDSKEVAKSLKKILEGNNEDVVNYENLTLGCQYEDIENDIFWDVQNNLIFVKGKENLKNMCVELTMAGYERLGVKRSEEVDEEYLSRSTDVPMIVKLFKLDPKKDAEHNRKLIKVIYN